MTSTLTQEIPGYLAGRWTIDPVHSEVSFTVRHLLLSRVRGRFTGLTGELVTGPEPADSRVTASVDLATVDTGNADRDAHVRSADFLDVETYPTLSYRSTGVRSVDGGFVVDGELSLHGVTRPVALELEVNGFQADTPFGDSRAGFSAHAQIDRRDFDVAFNMPLDNGGVALGNTVDITLEIQAVLQVPAETL